MTIDNLVMLGVAALAGFVVGATYTDAAGRRGNGASNGAYSTEHVVPAAPTQQLYCPRYQDRLGLRLMISHCPDGTPTARWCHHSCWYGDIDRRNAL